MWVKFILLFRYLRLKLFGGLKKCGWKIVLQHNVEFKGAKHISVGDYNCLNANVTLHAETIAGYKAPPKIILHNNIGIGNDTNVIAVKKIEIQDDVMIGPGCALVDFDHGYLDPKVPIRLQPKMNVKPILVKKGAWIGSNVTVCSGVTIGRNSVIGANSVVVSNIPDYCVALGSPAKVIKQYNRKTKKWDKIKKAK
jgi:serine acetyltransferase